MRALLMRAGATALVLLLLPAAAGADRPATDAEKAAILAGDADAIACTEVVVSTVDERWAALTPVDDGVCPPANGVEVVQRSGERWGSRWVGSDVGPSTACEASPVPAPDAVQRDLGLCVPASKARFLACAVYPKVRLARRPRRCSNATPSTSTHAMWQVVRIRWSRWGGARASGRGVSLPSHRYDFERPLGRPVRLEASRVVYWCGPTRPQYTRLTLHYSRFTSWTKPPGESAWRPIRYPARSVTVELPTPDRC